MSSRTVAGAVFRRFHFHASGQALSSQKPKSGRLVSGGSITVQIRQWNCGNRRRSLSRAASIFRTSRLVQDPGRIEDGQQRRRRIRKHRHGVAAGEMARRAPVRSGFNGPPQAGQVTPPPSRRGMDCGRAALIFPRRMAVDLPWASSPSMRANSSTTGSDFLTEFLSSRTMLVRRWNWSARMPENERPEPPVGSVWLGPARKSPTATGESLPR